MRYFRNSVLRNRGLGRNTVNLRSRVRRAEAQAVAAVNGLNAVRAVTSAVKVPNGTTRKIARIVDEAVVD